jgi:hypothetical protein
MVGTKTMKARRIEETKMYHFDPLTGFWGIPNLRRKVKFEQRPDMEIEVVHNDRGIRDVPFTPSDSKGTILCLGGSHSWGGAVTQEERYTDVLARRTGRQVVNMGHCSFGMDQVALTILQRTKEYHPQVIVVEQYPWAVVRLLRNYAGYNNIKPSFLLDKNGELKFKKLPWAARFLLFRKVLGAFHVYKKELREFQGGIDLQESYDPSTDPMFLHWKINYYDYLYALLEKIIIVIRDHCQQNGIHLLFSLGAIRQQFDGPRKTRLVDYDLPAKRLRNILDKSGIAYVDMTEPMFKAHSDDAPVIFNDGHINPKGHDIFAKVLQKDLEDRGWI